MSGLRIALVVVPPLLADLIRHVLGSRVRGVTFTELPDLRHAYTHLRQTGADAVIAGPSVPAAEATLIQSLLPHARVLTVSSDLSRLVELDTGEPVAFTLDELADRFRR